ncbi:hydroxyacylglutathione hydrolase [Roseateles violae]|uniref:Hydroxyacylglutathione hydrolase n=1 Tax=Roseateles violae TaxID=3058042 RepID=A0ABT8DZX1_9BURK|nr:hydroxyacylglutathione hydrolase [Pelomonas sp. PFR6]MDN3923095.1 hydroxyacylglutathione hydrolase [Pelomonas sp. PFR6]
MDLIAVAAFADNYIWMLHDGVDAIVVDPGEAAPVLEALAAQRLHLAGILVTHHHGDHVGGLAGLRPHLRGPVYGPAREDIPTPFTPCRAGDSVELLGLRFSVIDVPGHTAGHIAYYAEPVGEAPLLFCGDTLFSGGCGRLFEGSPAQMYASLQTLAALPGTARVCCAHEYTLSNLRFALTVEPDNAALRDYQAWCQGQRERALPTLPSSIATERQINPFLRCSEPAVAAAAATHQALPGAEADPVAVFASLRQWKNEFR